MQSMRQTRHTLWWTLGLVLVIELVLLYQLRGPSPQSADAPAEGFSAARAVAMLQRILGDQRPHPVGSLENFRVRGRLVKELRELGLDIEMQPGNQVTANTYSLCNILARLPHSPDTGRPLVLSTHYDSVRAGPGAADAGSCVAALLETARALEHGEPLQRPVYLLITDGEEAGLKGAAMFVQEHALAKAKPFVLNFDARGTSGPSLMYETHRGNLATVPVGPTARLLLSVGVASAVLLPLGNMLPVVFGARAGVLLCPVCTLVLSPLLPALVFERVTSELSFDRD